MRRDGRDEPLDAIIGRDGAVVSVRVVTAQVHPDFAQAAIDAVRQWQFTPTLLNGTPVEVVMAVTVDFELEDWLQQDYGRRAASRSTTLNRISTRPAITVRRCLRAPASRSWSEWTLSAVSPGTGTPTPNENVPC